MRTFIIQTMTIMGIMLLVEANNWIVEGSGLNPFIAIPIAMILFILPYPITDKRAIKRRSTL